MFYRRPVRLYMALFHARPADVVSALVAQVATLV